jgi:hypothetical protein
VEIARRTVLVGRNKSVIIVCPQQLTQPDRFYGQPDISCAKGTGVRSDLTT